MCRFLLLTAAMLVCGATAARGQQASGAAYDSLLARVRAGDTTVDYTALRMAYAASPKYQPYNQEGTPHRTAFIRALDARDFARAISDAGALLATDPLDIEAHAARAYALQQTGDSAAARRDRMFVRGMVRSITGSGSGTQSSPWLVISVPEEYAVLSMRGFDVRQQGVVPCGGHDCDQLDAENEDGAKKSFFFDVHLLKAAFLRQMPQH